MRRCAYDEALSWLDLASASARTPNDAGIVDRRTSRVLEQAGWREAPPTRARASLATRRMDPADLDLPVRA